MFVGCLRDYQHSWFRRSMVHSLRSQTRQTEPFCATPSTEDGADGRQRVLSFRLPRQSRRHRSWI